MNVQSNESLQRFNEEVAIKFQLYNSLFISLPFHKIEKTGLYLSLFNQLAEESYKKDITAIEIVDTFFKSVHNIVDVNEKLDLLFNFIQYAERQVVLFDAIEDAAFSKIHDLNGQGTLKQLAGQNVDFSTKDLQNFCVRLVLTAHPTQFYPGSVLGIIHDLANELKNNNTTAVNTLLSQLGRTPFIKKQKPTPYDEAVSLIWYLENVFYMAIGDLLKTHKENLPLLKISKLINMGFWPGGDRDGNPFVDADTTLKVADALKTSIIKCYYRDVRQLKRRLTFSGLEIELTNLENALNTHAYGGQKDVITSIDDILNPLIKIKNILVTKHDSLFVEEVNNLIDMVYYFGVHFAFIDIRQENDVHKSLFKYLSEKNSSFVGYDTLNEKAKCKFLLESTIRLSDNNVKDNLHKDVIQSIKAMKKIQEHNGKESCHRYIISQCGSITDILEVYALMKYCVWHNEQVDADVVPLFETIEDLGNAVKIMTDLLKIPKYKQHIKQRNNTQIVMLGFSDGTKDGGYLMANYAIYNAKIQLTEIANTSGIDIIFFDGRGGPPGRGGGKTHKFYASLGSKISSKEIQLTIQGQTISSNFGNIDSAKYNIEQLISAGITNLMNQNTKSVFTSKEEVILEHLAKVSLKKYLSLKNDEKFMDYLSDVSPLKYFGKTNIGSRPTKRGKSEKLTLKDLRAIPFVASWNMLKQNIPGFYGLGTALQQLEKEKKFDAIKKMYSNSLFFKTLIDNSEMALAKSNFKLTSHLKNDENYKEIWNNLLEEYELTKKYLLILSDKSQLMQDYPTDAISVEMREKIVVPLITIQQYALNELRNNKLEELIRLKLENLIIRSSFGIINAGRNSA